MISINAKHQKNSAQLIFEITLFCKFLLCYKIEHIDFCLGDFMSISRILDGTSSGALDVASRKALFGLFDKKYQQGKSKAFEPQKIFELRRSLTVSLDVYGSRLEHINPAIFPYLNVHQKQVIEQELLYAFYIFSAQYHLDEVEQKRQCLKERSEQIHTCASLINQLRQSLRKETPESLLEKKIDQSEKHAKYLGLKAGPEIAALMLRLTTETDAWEGAGKTEKIKTKMGGLNVWRLYWVWGGSFTSLLISLLPDDFFKKQQAQSTLSTPAPFTGYLSWILYYARFGINLSLLLKHTIAGPWMNVEEKKLFAGEKYPTWMRFKTQWDQRKFTLLNDSIWATANLACFFWLIGEGMMGYFGNIATTALLFMDTCISIWRYCEEDTQHQKDMVRYERDLKILRRNIRATSDEGERHRLQLELQTLTKAKKKCEFDWRYKTYGLQNDIVYAVGLMVAFAVMCGVLCPPSVLLPATALLLGVIGVALCFTLSVIYAGVGAGIDMAKVRTSKVALQKEGQALLKEFVGTKDEMVKKRLYLEMKQMVAETDEKAQQIRYQQRVLMRDMILKVMIPPLVFLSLVFMPLGVGLGVLAVGFAIAVISHKMIEDEKPGKTALPKMDEVAFARFAKLKKPTLDDLNSKPALDQKKAKGGFFHKDWERNNLAPMMKEPLPTK